MVHIPGNGNQIYNLDAIHQHGIAVQIDLCCQKCQKPFSPIALISRFIYVSCEPMYLDVNVESTNHFCTYPFICALGIVGSFSN